MPGVIIKPIKQTDHTNVPQSRSIGPTIDYVHDAKGHGDKLHIVDGEEVRGTLNMFAFGHEIAEQKKEIAQHHSLYTGTGVKLGHYVLSYASGEGRNFSAVDFEQDVKCFLWHMGMSKQKCIYTVHANTENIHIHILVDRVSNDYNKNGKLYIPLNVGTVVLPDKKRRTMVRHDVYCMHAAMFEICASRCLSLQGIKTEYTGKPLTTKPSTEIKLSSGAVREEKSTGKPSMQRMLLETADKIFATSTNWNTALMRLAEEGIQYHISRAKDGTVRGAFLTQGEAKAKSSQLPTAYRYMELRKSWGNHPDTPYTKKDIRTFLIPIFTNAFKYDTNYDNLLKRLENYGFKLRESGGSYVVDYNQGTEHIKLSAIGNNVFSKKKLDEAFAFNAENPDRTIEDKPKKKAKSKKALQNELKIKADKRKRMHKTKLVVMKKKAARLAKAKKAPKPK